MPKDALRVFVKQAYLMIGNENNPLGKVKLDTAILELVNLSRHRVIPADSHRDRPPELRHDRRRDREISLRHGHVGIVPLAIDPVQRRSGELCHENATHWPIPASQHVSVHNYQLPLFDFAIGFGTHGDELGRETYARQHAVKYTPNDTPRRIWTSFP